jgi:acetate---CoA ligase (ADP-forming)
MSDIFAVEKLKKLFEPKSIALIGQSGSITETYDVTTSPLVYLLKYQYQGKIFPVNPKYQEICGYKCYPTFSDITEPVDVVFFLVAADRVIPLLEECALKNVKAVVIASSGFAETGERGKKEQQKIIEIAQKSSMVILGPNCNGFVNLIAGVPITFSPSLEGEKVEAGEIGFVSQSGATLSGIASRAKEMGIGFSYLIGTGNEAQVELIDCINYMVEDPSTKVIMALIEGFKDGRKFLQVAEKALQKRKPIVVLKLGQSEVGKKSALSHTGNLAGNVRVNDAAFRQKGVLVAEETNDFIESARILTQLLSPKGNGIGIVSTSGGTAGLAADLVIKRNLRVGKLSQVSLDDLSKMIRWFATAGNPFDFAGQILRDDTFAGKVFDLFLKDDDIHVLLLAMTPVQKHDVILIRSAIASRDKFQKPLVILYVGGKLDPQSENLIKENHVPFFTSPTECVRALENWVHYSTFLNKETCKGRELSSPISQPAKKSTLDLLGVGRKEITEREAKLLLSQYGIPVTREKLATDAHSANQIADSLGYPVVLKVESKDILHKTDVGGVKLNIRNAEELKAAFEEMVSKIKKKQPQAEIQGILVQEMIQEQGIEAIVGISRDPQYGPTVMFGLGGVLVEVLEDVALRICPITEADAFEMIREVKGFKILQGFRGRPMADVEAIVSVLLRLSQLAMDLEENISEMDINPLLVFQEGKGVIALDSRIVLR